MQNPRLAARYAKSMIDLAVEKNSLEEILGDMRAINNICRQSRDFELMLKSPVVTSDKKLAVIFAVLERYNINATTRAFVNLITAKGRELNLPEIAAAFLEQYNEMKNIRTVKLTTAAPVNDAIKTSIMDKVQGYMAGSTVALETTVDEGLIGGFVVEVEDKLYDASVRKSLNDIRTTLIDYSYVSKM